MELAKAMRNARVIRVMGVAAAALWLGSAAMLTLPRTVHAQDDSGVSNDNSAANDDSSDVNDNDDSNVSDSTNAVSPAATPPSLAGAWSGSASDHQHGSGTVAITFSQANNFLTATWEVDFGDPSNPTSLGGAGTGKIKGKTLHLTLTDLDASKKCKLKFSGKITASGGVGSAISGNYNLTGCFKNNSKGTIDLVPTPS